jgi:hypothetical protein
MSRKRIEELLESVDHFGPLHIVVGDGNMDDSSVAFCEGVMDREGGAPEERELIGLLKAIPVEEREELWGLHVYGETE